ncbi:MAG: cupin domain-containing protein [Chitinophagaceae bacterium]|nr:cupin domain-containing protein [Chitinophagaceae bacterium]
MPRHFVEQSSIPWQQMAPGVRRKIMAFEESIMLVRVEFEKGAIGSVHKHFHVQMTSVESGVFEIEIAGCKKILRQGDVFHVPSDLLHGAVCLEAGVLIDTFSPMREDFL